MERRFRSLAHARRIVNRTATSERGALRAGTCEYVLRHDFDLHLQRVFGGVGDLGGDVGDLADEHGVQELRLLHPHDHSHTAVLEETSRL